MYNLTRGDSIGPYPYLIEHRLSGQGAMSEVYLAVVRKPYRKILQASKVVIKIAGDSKLDTNNRGISNEEAYLPGLNHSGVVRMIPIWGNPKSYRARATPLPGEPWFCVFEYIPGGSLTELLRKSKRGLSLTQTVSIARNLADVLTYLHSHGIVHMDLKPSNVLFSEPSRTHRHGQPVLIDFGIARAIGELSTSGTATYMAPERYERGGRQFAHPSMDIYALGILLYEMLTGSTPKGQLPAPASQLRASTWEQEVVAQSLDPITVAATYPDPRMRPSAAAIQEKLEQVKIENLSRRWTVAIVILLAVSSTILLLYLGAANWLL